MACTNYKFHLEQIKALKKTNPSEARLTYKELKWYAGWDHKKLPPYEEL